MNIVRRVVFGMAVTLMITIAANATSLIGTWSANNNGVTGTIVVNSQDLSGNIQGTAFGDPMKGFYSNATNKVRFWRATGAMLPDQIQIYTGYTGKLCMVGTYESFAGTGATAVKPDYGWNASK
jgi:hypothetical protein